MTVYLDDILVFSSSVKQHLLNLRAVFEKLCSDKLFAEPKICFFGKMSAKYFGHIVEVGSLRADPDKVEAIGMWPNPTTVKEL